jgi:hypothetical protein
MLLFGVAPMGERDVNLVLNRALQFRLPVLIVGVYRIPWSLCFETVRGTLFAIVPSGTEA